MIDILMIADDMTGMLDTAVQFANRGITADAFLGEVTLEDLQKSEASIVAVTTESRHLTKEEAYQRVFEVSKMAKCAGAKMIFKKTDSVLRGHIGAEFEAVMNATGNNNMLFFPAYPEMERTTKKGIQYKRGVPVHESSAEQDQLEPVADSFIPKLIATETEIEVELVSKETKWKKQGGDHKIYVFDSESESELYEQICEVKKNNDIEIIAGCAGLAKELAKVMPNAKKKWRAVKQYNNIFAVFGSVNNVTRKQVAYAAEHGFTYFPIPIDDLLGEKEINVFYKEEIVNRIKEASRQRKPIVIAPVRKKESTVEMKKDFQPSVKIVNRLNDILIECMEELKDYTLFHTGGDTLSSFIYLGGCKKIVVCGEMFPGVAINKFIFDDYEKYVISKSGGFGEQDILVKCLGQT